MTLDTNNLLISAYSLTGGIMLLGFLPQLWNLLIATGRSKAISVSTYFLWFISTFIGGLYAIHIAEDSLIALISFGASTGNILIILLTLYNRHIRFRTMAYEGETGHANI